MTLQRLRTRLSFLHQWRCQLRNSSFFRSFIALAWKDILRVHSACPCPLLPAPCSLPLLPVGLIPPPHVGGCHSCSLCSFDAQVAVCKDLAETRLNTPKFCTWQAGFRVRFVTRNIICGHYYVEVFPEAGDLEGL